jgi:phosphoesterase RecJ-like protein
VGFCDYNYLDPKASSTGELLYELLFTDDMPISKEVASAIYVAILMDTGGFRYSNTSSRTMEVVAKLFAAGINYVDLNIEVYQNVPVNKFKMTNLILSTLELSHDNRVGFVYITEDMLKTSNLELDDTDGVIENVRDIDSVEVALFIKEVSPNVYKGSARSKRFYDVSSYCMQFGGGGHVHAAGFTIEGSFEEIKERMLNAIEFK